MSPDSPSATVTSPPDATRTGGGIPPSPSPTGPPDAPPGFALDREIGAGGMGVVYLARQTGLNRPVALKTVRPGTTLDPRALIRFLAEAEAVASVRHPNVVEVYSFGEHAGRPYLALEYCSGGDLTTVSKADQTRDANWFRRTAELMAKIADGVNAAHAQGIVHRDLKPANVLLTADGTPKVTDFGLAKRGLGSDLTQTTDVLGTPAYMAPEQASGRTKFVGPEADVLALGVMLYELLSGTRPFDAPTPLQIMAAVAKAEVPKLRDRFPTIPTDLALVAHKCLAADPRDRYPTAGPLSVDLRNWLDGKPVSARPVGVIESAVKWVKRNKRATLTGAGVLLTMATATAVSLGFGIDATQQRKKAEEEKQAAVEARNDLAKANEKTERALGRAMIAQFIASRLTQEGIEVNDIHWQFLDARRTHFGLIVTDEIIRTEPGTNQEDFISHELLHSITGLDSARKREMDRRIATAIHDDRLPLQCRHTLTLAAARCGYWDESQADLTSRVLAVRKSDLSFVSLSDWAEALDECGSRNPDQSDLIITLMLSEMHKSPRSMWNVDICNAVGRLLHQLPEHKSERVVAEIVELMRSRAESTADPFDRNGAVRCIGAILPYAPPKSREQVADSIADAQLQDFRDRRVASDRDVLADGMIALCPHLSPPKAAQVADEIVSLLLRDAESADFAQGTFARACARFMRWLPKEKGQTATERLVKVLLSQLNSEKHGIEMTWFVDALPEVCLGLPPEQAELVFLAAQKEVRSDRERMMCQQGLARCGGLPSRPEAATRSAEWLVESHSRWRPDLEQDVPLTLEALCVGLTREELHRRKAFPAVASGLLPPDTLPKPKPLPPQVLVDLLKRPFVVREKQRAVLNALEITYDRKFKDLWEFVAFAEKEHKELDLLTPPKRPQK